MTIAAIFDVIQASPLKLSAGIVICTALAPAAAWFAWYSFRKARILEDIPICEARSATPGYVELEGVARALSSLPLVAPISRRPCVWYRYRIEAQPRTKNPGTHRHHWDVTDKDESTETFWLEDDSGRVVVDPNGADISPKHMDTWESIPHGTGKPGYPDFVSHFLSNHSNDNLYRFTEWRIGSGDPVYALGLLRNVGDLANAPVTEKEIQALLHEWKKDQPKLEARFDLNKDHQIDEKEWLLARAQARREIMKAHREQQRPFNNGVNLLGATKDPNRPYILSAHPQSQMVRRYRWQAALGGIGFLLFVVTAAWLLTG
ncbi:MAG: hypothetical protein A2140_09905 [Candidatus Muproteobacteria bacterium RBG_16_62_13]|uniref:RING-type E3 ubiquitin transferase n=1 Tax=Candidatus Muproteobacteria bacterium RBG_16_62_13 TaxID=1817756 RepID=A0A1F6SY23_9PROT|nr:MAG: hypothetical protein A2140_09905 [Candidatus Muproteobacteria bacterium RBG_16_62_13]